MGKQEFHSESRRNTCIVQFREQFNDPMRSFSSSYPESRVGRIRKMMGSPTSTAPWKQLLLDALHSNSSLKHSSFFQLVPLSRPSLREKVSIFEASPDLGLPLFSWCQATVGSNGRPSNRTVVFRSLAPPHTHDLFVFCQLIG